MNKKLTAAFEDSIQRGKNEEIGSMDTIKVDGVELIYYYPVQYANIELE